MTDQMFRMLELLQKLDDVLRRKQRQPQADHRQIARLLRLKLDVRSRLTRLSGHPPGALLPA